MYPCQPTSDSTYKKVALLIPNFRQISGTTKPLSTLFRASIMWLSVNLIASFRTPLNEKILLLNSVNLRGIILAASIEPLILLHYRYGCNLHNDNLYHTYHTHTYHTHTYHTHTYHTSLSTYKYHIRSHNYSHILFVME